MLAQCVIVDTMCILHRSVVFVASGGDEAGADNVFWGAGTAERGAQSRHSGCLHRRLCAHVGQRRLQHPAGPTAAAVGAERCFVWPYCHRPWHQAGKHRAPIPELLWEHDKVNWGGGGQGCANGMSQFASVHCDIC